MADEELHEVQLNGKQLVFSFMVVTVIAVVIFLCGVMVGRNLRRPATELAAASADSTLDATESQSAVVSPSSSPDGGAPVSAQETLTYGARLDSPVPAGDGPRGREAARAAVTPSEPAIESKPLPPVAAPPDRSLSEPPGNGYVLQVMAVTTRAEAEAIARRLVAKGYPTFVTTTGEGTAHVSYRVRVGKYDDKSEADRVFARLQKEEQFKPWLTH